jgi:hypothetical protein
MSLIPVPTWCEAALAGPFGLSGVDADDTGCRGRELRKGGDAFDGAAEMYAFKLLLVACSGFLDLPPARGVLWVGVMVRLPGGVTRVAGLHGRD